MIFIAGMTCLKKSVSDGVSMDVYEASELKLR